jgi:serine/threonine-protein kinase
MGEVYEAWDIVLARPVALKVLRHLEPAAMIRFMHEAQLHARLDNPNICRIYDVDATGGTPRIAMQLIRGTTLQDAARDLALGEVVAILAQVAEAVHGAHQLNLIHRDIKPGNILLQRREGGGWTPYLCDFGLAMALDGPSVTQPLALTGTPAYMAPEQVRGDRSLVGPPTDVYGLGSTLYFALVGRPPCVSTITSEMLKVKRECRFPSPRSLAPDIPPDLEAVLFKCLQPEPRDRYASAAELAEALGRIHRTLAAGGRPGRSGPLGWVTRTGSRKALVAALAGAVCLAGALPPLAGLIHRSRPRPDEATQALARETAGLDQALRAERLLPAHDLRPARTAIRTRLEDLGTRLDRLGPAAPGPAGFALAQLHYLLGDLAQARARLDQAWAAGFRTPEAALLQVQIQLRTQAGRNDLAAFQGRVPAAPGPPASPYLPLTRLQTTHPRAYPEALAAALAGDDARAAQAAREALAANPWHLESAVLAATSLSRLARGLLDAGDAAGAAADYREALDLVRDTLPRGPSDPRLHHAGCAAAIGLAALDLDRGALSARTAEELLRQAGRGLRLDPDDPDAQSDWLQACSLKAMRLLELGQDPGEALDQALRFFWSRTREPRTTELRMDHLVLYWLQAERDFGRGEDPGPALAEALKDPGHTATRSRDFLGDLLNLKLRVDAARGIDPRPGAEALLARLEPAAGRPIPASLRLALARSWLTRAEWEAEHGIDPLDSIRQAQGHLRCALEERPDSAPAHALQGLSRILEARARPERRRWLLGRTGAQLRQASRSDPADPDAGRLRRALAPARPATGTGSRRARISRVPLPAGSGGISLAVGRQQVCRTRLVGLPIA